jgi:hypothetical protein
MLRPPVVVNRCGVVVNYWNRKVWRFSAADNGAWHKGGLTRLDQNLQFLWFLYLTFQSYFTVSSSFFALTSISYDFW